MQESYHTSQAYLPNRYKQFPQAQTGHKYCVACEQEKPFDAFHRMKANHDGYRPVCKVCRKKESNTPSQHSLPVSAKVCTKCRQERAFLEFDADQNGKFGLTSQCKQCRSVHNAEFRKENYEHFQTYDHKRNHSPERKDQRKKRYQERSATDPQFREIRKQQRRKHYLKYPEQAKDFCLRRRARLLRASVGKVDYQRILERDGYFCYICQKSIDPDAKPKTSGSLSFDHVIPLDPRPGNPQGTHSEENIKPAHLACNTRKSNRPFESLTPFLKRGV